MHEPEYILQNETQKILWYFQIQMDHLILARRRDQVSINKKKKRKQQTKINKKKKQCEVAIL